MILLLILLVTMIILIYYYPKPANIFVVEYRFNRVLEAVLSGIVLGFTGAYLQSSLKNPLVDHYILGIGGGALFSVYLLVLFIGVEIYLVPLTAITGGLIALTLTVLIAESIGGSDISYVLSGIGVNSLFSGASILLSYMILAKQPYAIHILMGSFITASPRWLPHTIIALIIVSTTYPLLAKPLNTLLLGDTYAYQLGVDPGRVRLYSIITAGVASSIIVGCFGLIGFIGLVSPHIARLIARTTDNRIVIPFSGLLAGLILLTTDTLSRTILVSTTGEIPAGAISSVFGAPFFLILLYKRFKAR